MCKKAKYFCLIIVHVGDIMPTCHFSLEFFILAYWAGDILHNTIVSNQRHHLL